MKWFQVESEHSAKTLILVGIPAFLIAVLISMTTHRYAHILVDKMVCQHDAMGNVVQAIDPNGREAGCPLASVAAVAWTLILSLSSFAVYMRYPGNLFAGAMTFVNASMRLPQTITIFLQLLLYNNARFVADESSFLSILHLNDPTISVIIMCFISLVTVFLSVIVIHDTKVIPWKWVVASSLFVLMIPVETILWPLISRVIG